jgi:hypothetical protein
MAIRTGPVGYSFTVLRILQCLGLIPIIALCTCLAAEINQLSVPRPPLPVALCLSLVRSAPHLSPTGVKGALGR